MKRHFFKSISVLILALCLALPAFAEDYTGSSDWHVSFNGKKMESNFSTNQIDDVMTALQPGDNAVVTLKLSNDSDINTAWYMENEVLKSLEDSQQVANNGGYSYRLTYINMEGTEKVLFSSELIGGEKSTAAGEGLHEATNSLDQYFYLDDLKPNESGRVVLSVSLDGETEGNAYQDTFARLKMNFAVERRTTGNTPPPEHPPVVRTNDSSVPVIALVLSGTCGMILLVLGIYTSKKSKEGRKK